MSIDTTTDRLPAVPDTTPSPLPRRGNAFLLLLSQHRTTLGPWGWMATADITAISAHYGASGIGWAAITAAGASAAVSAASLWRTRYAALKKRIKTARTVHKIQADVRRAVALGSLWELVASTWTPFGPHGVMQLTLVGGGLVLAAPHLYRNRRRPAASEPAPEIEAPREDRRLAMFREQFCGRGPLQDARLHGFVTFTGGFRFQVTPQLARGGTYTDVKRIEELIAALYDVALDQVSVELPAETRSHRSGVVSVLDQVRAHQREEPWDGRSTYDPGSGCFVLGRFADGSASHWQLNIPYNGAASGLIVGFQGTGKSGSVHVVCGEAAQAKLCAECATAGTCRQCSMERICAVWVGDPQCQPMGVWRGHADLTAWGPLSCVRMLAWMHAAMRDRADAMGRMVWTDHLGRTNQSKGWFDPTPQTPQILAVIDEWPLIMADAALAPWATYFALSIIREGRKVGFSLVLVAQDGDVDGTTGDRGVRDGAAAYNALGHRCDSYAKRQLGLDGNPADLPPGVHGTAYLGGYDKRSGIVQRTKHLREYLRPGEYGVDVREIAERVSRDPVTYDRAVLDAIVPLGYTGPGQILVDGDGWTLDRLTSAQHTPEPELAAQPETAPSTFGSAPPAAVQEVRKALNAHPGADVYDLMEATGLSALDVTRSVAELIADGAATPQPAGRYAPCN